MKNRILVVLLTFILVMSLGLSAVFADDPANRSELADQKAIDEAIKTEISYGYTWEEPLVIVDPYGTAALSAMIAFDTENECEVQATVKGHAPEDDIVITFEAAARHILPIYGLYPAEENTVELVCDGKTAEIKITTDAVEEPYTQAEVTVMDAEKYNYNNLTFVSGIPPIVYNAAYDSKGDLRWISEFSGMPFFRLSNGHFLSETIELVDDGAPLYAKGVAEIDLMGRIYNKYFISSGAHHDAIELPNGNLLVCTRHADLSVMNCRVVEIDRATGEIVWELDMCDLIDPSDGNGMDQNPANWFHNNCVFYDEERDLLLFSSRQTDSIVAVKKSTKELVWILGDPEGWTTVDPSYFFTPKGDNFEWQYAQHDVSLIDGNKILLFDNGVYRVKKSNAENALSDKDMYSRAVMYQIDTENMTVEQIWEYGKERGNSWYSAYICGTDYDPELNSFWIDNGGVRYDPEADTYDIPLTFDSLKSKVHPYESYSYVENIVDDELVYELKLMTNTFRSKRYAIYGDESVIANYDLDSECWLFDVK